MNFALIFTLAFVLASAAWAGKNPRQTTQGKNPHRTTQRFFHQQIDHFSNDDDRTFLQRFYMIDRFYKKGGPIVVEIGGEYELTRTDDDASFCEIARRHNGLVISLEHRYYGKSMPFKGLSVEEMKYLSVDQAVDDLRYFRKNAQSHRILKHFITDASKWIFVGGSYSGALAAIFASRYPKLYSGIWASSAPAVWKTDFPEYDEYITEHIAAIKPNCPQQMRNDLELVEKSYDALKHDPKKLAEFTDRFSPGMSKLTSKLSFFFVLSDATSYLVQYGDYYNFIGDYCKNKFNSSDAIDNYAQLINKTYTDFSMTPTEADMTDSYGESSRVYNWLGCHSFGYLLTASTNREKSVRSTVTSFEAMWKKICEVPFGVTQNELAKTIQKHNEEFSKLLDRPLKLVITQGTQDPYNSIGFPSKTVNGKTKISYNGTTVALKADGTHCQDYWYYYPDDSVSGMRNATFDLIAQFLAN